MINQELSEDLPYLIVERDVVIEANYQFFKFTNFPEQEIVGSYISDLLSILRLTPKFESETQEIIHNRFLFTKSLDYRNVKIKVEKLSSILVKYTFCEKHNSRFENKFICMHKLFTDERLGVGLYSVPGLTLIKANQAYLNMMDHPFNNIEAAIGMQLDDLADWSKIDGALKVISNVISTGETFYGKELKGMTGNCINSYCDSTIMPIEEEGEVRYVISIIEDVTERVLNRQRVEEQAKIIEHQNKQLEAIIENMSDGLFIIDADGKFTFLNDGAKEFFYNSDLLHNAGDEFKHTAYYDMDGSTIPLEQMPGHKVLRGEKIKASRVTSVRPDGTYHFNFSGSPFYDENGKIIKAVMCSHNVTDQVERENLIKFQKKQLELIIDNISEELCVFDKDRNYILLNKTAREKTNMSGLKKLSDYVTKYGYYDMSGGNIRPDDMPSVKLIRGEAIKDYTYLAYDPDKRYLCTNGTPIFDENGNFIMGILSRRDVTNEILYKQTIEQQLEMLCRLIHNLDLPLLRLSYPDLTIIDINVQALKMVTTRHPDTDFINRIRGMRITEIMPRFIESYNYTCICEAVKERKTTYNRGIKHVVNGQEIYSNIIFEPVFGLNGEINEILSILVDVTNEVNSNKAMERMLSQQEEFFTNISHELKTPLNVIYSAVQLLKMYCNGSLDENKDSIIRHIGAITQNCYRLSRLINNIVDVSKIEAGFYELNKSNHNIVDVVEEIVMSVTDYTESKGLNIVFDTDTEEKIINCDPEKIERVILNLVSNAIKFSDAGNEICVEVCDKEDFVEISVKDNGTGIDKHHLDTIFDRFKQADKSLTRNAEGTGIGLSLVKSIVELHGGKISVDSEIGKGSKFTVLLPSGEIQSSKGPSDCNLMRNKRQIIDIELSDIY